MEKNEIMRGVEFWTNAIKQAGVFEKIPIFNDLITGKEAPSQTKDNPPLEPVLKNIKLADKIVDIYHWGGTSARLFIHIKN
jgi:hypothetical protein